MKNTMKCPVCRTELIVPCSRVYQDLCEHVCDPNGRPSSKPSHECPNKYCTANGAVFWDDMGDLYVMDTDAFKKIKFIDGNDAPFGSFSRQNKIEICKSDENYDFLTFKKFKIKRVFSYKADLDGNILKRKGHFEIWRKSSQGYVHHVGNLRMIRHMIGSIHSDFKLRGVKYTIEHLKSPRWNDKSIPFFFRDWFRPIAYYYAVCLSKVYREKIKS